MKENLKELVHKSIPFKTDEFSKGWQCLEKWSYSFLASYSDLTVKYNSIAIGNKEGKLIPPNSGSMLFGDFIKILNSGQDSSVRLFNFNLLNYKQELKKDFVLKKDFINGLYLPNPWLVFGAKGSISRLHYDVDFCPNFLTQINGIKTVWLFDPKDTKYLYRYPFAVHSSVNVKNPDLDKYPLYKHAKPRKYVLSKGETLYIPPGWWHYIEYTTSGYSLSVRSTPKNGFDFLQGILTIFVVSIVDSCMYFLAPSLWSSYKEKKMVNK